MAVLVIGEVRIGDLDQFLSVFSGDGKAKREEYGCHDSQVFAPQGEAGRVVVLMEWPDAESFERFRADPAVPPTMQKGGAQGPPTFTVLDRVG